MPSYDKQSDNRRKRYMKAYNRDYSRRFIEPTLKTRAKDRLKSLHLNITQKPAHRVYQHLHLLTAFLDLIRKAYPTVILPLRPSASL